MVVPRLCAIAGTLLGKVLNPSPDSKAHLNAVTEYNLSAFLATEGVGPTGERLLSGHLSREFPHDPIDELRDAARLLLSSKRDPVHGR